MSQYAAILGHQPHISVAELAAATEGFALTGKFQKMVALFDASTNMDFEMGKRLGGSVAIARKIKSSSGLTLEDLPKIVANETKDVKGKITFSLRTYGIPPKELHTLYRDCKKQLKKPAARRATSERTENQQRPCSCMIQACSRVNMARRSS